MIFCSLALFTASIIIGSIVSKGIWSSFDIGFAINWPPDSPSSFLKSWDLAIKEGLSSDNGDMKGLSLDQKAGKLVCPKVITGTPSVSNTSSVFGISKIALGPEQTTEILVFFKLFKIYVRIGTPFFEKVSTRRGA